MSRLTELKEFKRVLELAIDQYDANPANRVEQEKANAIVIQREVESREAQDRLSKTTHRVGERLGIFVKGGQYEELTPEYKSFIEKTIGAELVEVREVGRMSETHLSGLLVNLAYKYVYADKEYEAEGALYRAALDRMQEARAAAQEARQPRFNMSREHREVTEKIKAIEKAAATREKRDEQKGIDEQTTDADRTRVQTAVQRLSQLQYGQLVAPLFGGE